MSNLKNTGKQIQINSVLCDFIGEGTTSSYIIIGTDLQELADFIGKTYELTDTKFVYGFLNRPLYDLSEELVIRLNGAILKTQIAYRFNVSEDKVSNVQVDDEFGNVTADIEGLVRFADCGFIEEYAQSLEHYIEKIKG